MVADEGFYRAAGAALDVLVRSIVRDEMRRHLGPEDERLMNIRQAPMSHGKLRQLIASGALEGFKHGRDIFVRASDFRAYVERRPVTTNRVAVPEPAVDPHEDRVDEVRVIAGLQYADPDKQRAFELRLAARRAGGGERAAALAQAERKRIEMAEAHKLQQERAQRRAAKRGKPGGRV